MKLLSILLLLSLMQAAIAFVHNLNDASSTFQFQLEAKKKTQSMSSGAAGFGSPSKSASKSGKVRSVSGYTGSGTKPLRAATNTFDEIQKKYGKEATSDLYMRSPLNDEQLFWYVGKVTRRFGKDDEEMKGGSIPTEFEAVISQKRLIIEYAKNQLRPQNFGGPYAKTLEIWIAPGDSELDVVQNKVSLKKVTGSTSDLSETFSVNDVGFNPEIYIGDERNDGGLRVKRDENGDPFKGIFEISG